MAEYDPSSIEQKWQTFWSDNKTFAVGEPQEKKMYVLDMFPYPSGAGLHIGHPLGYTGTDIFCRYKRMQGFSVLHPMGYDAFGLPAEQHAINTGEHPSKVTRANCQRFTEQLKKLGFSYDWDRELATCDQDYYRWTQWIFLKIYNSWFDEEQQKARPISELPIPEGVKQQGEKAIFEYQAQHRLAYYSDAMVNWCPALGTVLANEEVIDGKSERGGHDVIRKPMKQWLLRITKYAERLLKEINDVDWPEAIKEQQRNWIGKRFGAEIVFRIDGKESSISAFTTRPDTLFGVTFVVVSPEHPCVAEVTTEQQRREVEEYCTKASKLSELARTLENREKTGVFTGSYVINPITDERVPLYIGDYVLMNYGTGAVMGVPSHDDRDFAFAQKYNIPIRPVIVPFAGDTEAIKGVAAGKMCWTEEGEMLPCDFPVAQEIGIAGKTNEEAKRLITAWLETNAHGKGVINYRLRDWLFSRQRYWGEPIPVIHWEDGTSTALSEDELPLVLPEVKEYKPSESGESPLARATEWLNVVDPKTGKKGRRETNTMPQWAGSCWYYLRFIDPKNDKAAWDVELEKKWMPVDLYVGGAEHAVLHLLYARFWHKVLFDLGYVSTKEPFQKLFNQGMLVSYAYKDSRGVLIPVDEVEEDTHGVARKKESGEVVERITAKMSKSLRNVINPDDVVATYGADTLRMYLMFMGPLEAMKMWDSQAINGVFRFLKKAYAFIVGADGKQRDVVAEESATALRARHLAIKKVTENLDALRFNTAISALMEFLNAITYEQVSKKTLEDFVLLLSPFAPHLGEELWQILGHSETVAYVSWPIYDEAKLERDTVPVVVQVAGKKRALIDVAVDVTEDDLKQAVILAMQGTAFKISEANRFIVVYQSGTKVPKLVNVLM
ncbi:MAG: leucine--tRNA ligase [Bdellovibrionota bacterium]